MPVLRKAGLDPLQAFRLDWRLLANVRGEWLYTYIGFLAANEALRQWITAHGVGGTQEHQAEFWLSWPVESWDGWPGRPTWDKAGWQTA